MSRETAIGEADMENGLKIVVVTGVKRGGSHKYEKPEE